MNASGEEGEDEVPERNVEDLQGRDCCNGNFQRRDVRSLTVGCGRDFRDCFRGDDCRRPSVGIRLEHIDLRPTPSGSRLVFGTPGRIRKFSAVSGCVSRLMIPKG